MKNYTLLLLVFLSFTSCFKQPLHKTNTVVSTIPIKDGIESDLIISKMIQPYKNELDSDMNRVLAYLPVNLDKKGLNSSLGKVTADLVLEESNQLFKSKYNESIDACILNSGGLRRTFTPGEISVRSVFELMPFDNMVVAVKLSGQKFLEMINYLRKENKGHPIAGFTFNMTGPELNILLDEKSFDDKQSYWVVTSDYLYNGGDNMTFLANAEEVRFLNIKLRDMILQNFEKIDTIQVSPKQRYLD